MRKVHVCDYRTIPTKGAECYEAVWSQGHSCKNCYRTDCYRQGWQKTRVDDDNAALVASRGYT